MVCAINQQACNKCHKAAWQAASLRFVWACIFSGIALAIVACSSLRPVVKIGLIAPFEGLYRRTGYDALVAMRMAIADTPVAGVDILPLALDDGNDPWQARRTAQKLLIDPGVSAVVGPLNPATLFRIQDLMPPSHPVWIAPFAITPDGSGFADPHGADAWATKLIGLVAEVAQTQQAHRLILAGWTPGWPALSVQAWQMVTKMPVLLVGDEIQAVASDDAVFWLGNPDEAALYLAKLRAKFPAVPFWLGPQGGDPVFAERIKHHGSIYWATWLGGDYPEWAAQHTPSTPAAYLVYQATRQAIATATDQTLATTIDHWQVEFFAIGEDGQSQPYIKTPAGG
ncbi:MAG: ABC transporter substrate-binding protein [Chloroflexi bacterium]|nr:ABC transporter substrate-binding protein [Chloroflexota bacterium]